MRNIGLFGVLELVRDRTTMEPMAPFNGTSDEMRAIDRYLLDHGVYTMVRWWDVMTNPPLCITEEELDEGFAVIDEALSAPTPRSPDRRMRRGSPAATSSTTTGPDRLDAVTRSSRARTGPLGRPREIVETMERPGLELQE